MSAEGQIEIPETRKDFEEFKKRIDAMLTEMEQQSLQIEEETEITLKLNRRFKSNSQFLLTEVNDFVKELQALKKMLSDVQQ